MALLASTFAFGTAGRGLFSGQLQWTRPDFAYARRIHFPPLCSAYERHPAVSSYLSRLYLSGGHTENILIDEDLRCLRQGMRPPPKPTVAVGAGTTPQVCYLTFWDEITKERSSLSDGAQVAGDLNRTWSALPTTDPSEQIAIEGTADIAAGVITGLNSKTNFGDLRPGDRVAKSTDLTRWGQVRSIASQTSMTIDDTVMAGVGVALVALPVSRASHLELWVSVFGALPRLATRVRLGTTSVVESVATLALGEAFIDSFEPMPVGAFSIFYNDRQITGGVPGSLDTVYLSQVGFPERHGGLRFKTMFGEPVVGLFLVPNYVVMLCPESSYRLQGYTDTDYVRTILDPKIGGLGHRGNKNCGDFVIVPGREGPQIFNGAFHPAMPTRQSEWAKDCRDNPLAYAGGFAAVNSSADDQTYRFFPYVHRIATSSLEPAPQPDPSTFTKLLILGLTTGNKAALHTFTLATSTLVTEDISVGGTKLVHSLNRRADGKLYSSGVATSVDFKLRELTLGPATLVEVATLEAGVAPVFDDVIEGDVANALLVTEGGTSALRKTFRYFSGVLTTDDNWIFNGAPAAGDGIDGHLGVLLSEPLVGFGNGSSDGVGAWGGAPPNTIRRRNAGAWSNPAMPTVDFLAICRPAVYGGKLWFGGIDRLTGTGRQGVLLSWDGTSVALAHTVPDPGAGLVNPIKAMAVFGGYLYYVYSGGIGAGYDARLGRYSVAGGFEDGLFTFAGLNACWALVAAGTNLYTVLNTGAFSGSWFIFKSAGPNVLSWAQDFVFVAPNTPNAGNASHGNRCILGA